MKSHTLKNLAAGALLLAGSQIALRAQQYSVDWYKIAGGGGASTGGVYSLSGTIGQPDAGHLSGGTYSVDGGFWGVIAAVQTPSAPLLRVALTTTNTVVISWPSIANSFHLQENATLGTTNWTIVVNPPTGNRLYRLRLP
jgi:hypothetical protein